MFDSPLKHRAPGQAISRPSSLRRQITMGMLMVLSPVLLVGAYAVPAVWNLGAALRSVLENNYISIQCAQHLQAVLSGLRVAELEGDAKPAIPGLRDEFFYWLNIEYQAITEVGEPETARNLDDQATQLFTKIAVSPPGIRHDSEFDQLFAGTNTLIRLNEMAMWRNDVLLRNLSRRVASTLILSFLLAFAVGIGLSWLIAKNIARPLTELASELSDVGEDLTISRRLEPQTVTELQLVAESFNQMATRLEYYQRLNVERLLFEKKKVESILQNLEHGVVLIDREGIVAHINEIAQIVLGLDGASVVGKPFSNLPTGSRGYIRIRNQLSTPGKNALSYPMELDVNFRGRDHNFLVNQARLSEEDELGILLTFQDVTYLRDQDRARAELVATLSHELRNPLTSLGLAAQFLAQRPPDCSTEHQKLVQVILSEFSRMSDLIEQLMNASRQRFSTIALHRDRVSISAILDDLAQCFSLQAAQRNIKLELNSTSLPEIYGDSAKISWVVSNLVTDTFGYTREGGVVEVDGHCSTPDSIRLEIKNTGPGISREVQKRVFEPVEQYTVSANPLGIGSLGFLMIKDVVAAHGGRIFVESSGEGSKFIVDLPVGSERN